MEISKRISKLSPSPTVALNAKANQLKQDGVDVLNFGVGEPDFSTPSAIVRKAIECLEQGKTRYGPAGGSPALRKAVSDKLKRENDLDFAPDQIVCGIGAKEILFHTFLALLNDDDEVILPCPYWVSYSEQVKAAGAKPVLVPFSAKSNRILDLEAIEANSTAKTKIISLNSPNNPAGYVLDRNELEDLGNYLKAKNWWIISDEIYEYLSFDKPHYSLLQVCPELKDRFLLVNGLSKGFAMTGWRVGYLAAPELVAKKVKSLQSHSSTCIPPFIDEPSAFALTQGKELMAKECEDLKSRRDYAVSLLDAIPSVSYIKPEGAFYAFVDVREPLKGSRFAESGTLGFAEELLVKYHIAVVPGEAFGSPGYLRFSYATSRETLKAGIDRFAKALKEL